MLSSTHEIMYPPVAFERDPAELDDERRRAARLSQARAHELRLAADTAQARLDRRRGRNGNGNARTIRRAIAAPLASLARAIEG